MCRCTMPIPGVTGANEVTGGAYARQGPVAFANAGNNPTVASNTAIVTFPQATAAGVRSPISVFGAIGVARAIFSVRAR